MASGVAGVGHDGVETFVGEDDLPADSGGETDGFLQLLERVHGAKGRRGMVDSTAWARMKRGQTFTGLEGAPRR